MKDSFFKNKRKFIYVPRVFSGKLKIYFSHILNKKIIFSKNSGELIFINRHYKDETLEETEFKLSE